MAKTEAKPTKQISQGVLAGRLYERLKRHRDNCAAELAQLPDEVRARYAAKERADLEAAGPELSRMALAMFSAEEES